jgi:hypothetical protein
MHSESLFRGHIRCPVCIGLRRLLPRYRKTSIDLSLRHDHRDASAGQGHR